MLCFIFVSTLLQMSFMYYFYPYFFFQFTGENTHKLKLSNESISLSFFLSLSRPLLNETNESESCHWHRSLWYALLGRNLVLSLDTHLLTVVSRLESGSDKSCFYFRPVLFYFTSCRVSDRSHNTTEQLVIN